jgi:hypothetical protein
MQQRLASAAGQYAVHGKVAQIALFDIAYPKNREEYRRMNGFGVLWITALSHDPKELPLKAVRVDTRHTSIALAPINTFRSTERNKEIVEVFGAARTDAVYLVPLFRQTQGARLLIDYARNRYNFLLGEMAKPLPPEIGTLAALLASLEYPSKEIFLPMLYREFPMNEALLTERR